MGLFYSDKDAELRRRLEDQPQIGGRLFRRQMAQNVGPDNQALAGETEVPTPEETVHQDVQKELNPNPVPDSNNGQSLNGVQKPSLFKSQNSQDNNGISFGKNLGYSILGMILGPGFVKRATGTDEGTIEKLRNDRLAQEHSDDIGLRKTGLDIQTQRLGLDRDQLDNTKEWQKTQAELARERIENSKSKIDKNTPTDDEEDAFRKISISTQKSLISASPQKLAAFAASKNGKLSDAAKYVIKTRPRPKYQDLTVDPYTKDDQD